MNIPGKDGSRLFSWMGGIFIIGLSAVHALSLHSGHYICMSAGDPHQTFIILKQPRFILIFFK